tara:strand:+ start:1248 stop:1454 length:207 start_codon:yes stop_codon:yes gene_type:complete
MRVKQLLDYLKDLNPKASVELLTQNKDGEDVWYEVQDVWSDHLDENVYLEFGIDEDYRETDGTTTEEV